MSNGSTPSDATVTHPTPYSGSTMLGKVGAGNYGTTSSQLDTSGGNAYGEGGASDFRFITLSPQGK